MAQKKSWRERVFEFFNNIYAGAALMVICAVAAILYTRFGTVWERPIINGLVTGAVVLSLYLSVRAVLSLPAATVKTTPENVGEKVLAWLHKFHLTVKSCPEPGQDFFYFVTTDGGKKIAVKRELNIYPDYIVVLGFLTLTDEEKRIVDGLSDSEKFEALFAIQREIWRGRFGFDSRDIVDKGLHLWIRIPITASISENDVLDSIWRMEAILGNILAVNARSAMHYKIRAGELINETGLPRGTGSPEEVRRGNEEAISGKKDTEQPIQETASETK